MEGYVYTKQHSTGNVIINEGFTSYFMETRYNMCVKRHVIAVVIGSNGKPYIGHNMCLNPQYECPRLKDEGYEKCKSICDQPHHAEPMAILKAGKYAKGGVIMILNHERVCDNCKKIIKEAGIKDIIIIPLIQQDNFNCLEDKNNET